jgi:hypothetical protein
MGLLVALLLLVLLVMLEPTNRLLCSDNNGELLLDTDTLRCQLSHQQPRFFWRELVEALVQIRAAATVNVRTVQEIQSSLFRDMPSFLEPCHLSSSSNGTCIGHRITFDFDRIRIDVYPYELLMSDWYLRIMVSSHNLMFPNFKLGDDIFICTLDTGTTARRRECNGQWVRLTLDHNILHQQ